MKEMYSSPFLRLDNTIHTVNGYGVDIYDMKCAMAIRPVY